jgi:hypothetical protein
MKKSAKSSSLFCFGLRNDGILYLQAAIPGTIVDSPAFLEQGSVEKIAVYGQPVIPTRRIIRRIFV